MRRQNGNNNKEDSLEILKGKNRSLSKQIDQLKKYIRYLEKRCDLSDKDKFINEKEAKFLDQKGPAKDPSLVCQNPSCNSTEVTEIEIPRKGDPFILINCNKCGHRSKKYGKSG